MSQHLHACKTAYSHFTTWKCDSVLEPLAIHPPNTSTCDVHPHLSCPKCHVLHTHRFSEVIWPWTGNLIFYLRVMPSAATLSGVAQGQVTFTVLSPPRPATGSEEFQRSVVTVPIKVNVIPTPDRTQRVIWDQFHSIKYPPGKFWDQKCHKSAAPGHNKREAKCGKCGKPSDDDDDDDDDDDQLFFPVTPPPLPHPFYPTAPDLHTPCLATGYIPRDNLDIKHDILDWHGDHLFTNFHVLFDRLRDAGYFVEVGGNWY